jgi:hypothetical protein
VHRLGLVLAEKARTLYSIAKIRSLLPAMENDELQNYGGTCYFNRNTSVASCACEMRLPLRILTKRGLFKVLLIDFRTIGAQISNKKVPSTSQDLAVETGNPFPFIGDHKIVFRRRRRERAAEPVSSTSCDLRLSVWSQTSSISITQVSHTSRDIFVTVCRNED